MRQLPAYRSDPKQIVATHSCQYCGERFPVSKKYPQQRFCSRGCSFRALNPTDHNAIVARSSAKQRGDRQRGRGEGKSYPKLDGKHAHRRVMEDCLGRKLAPGEIVHHRDENRLNYQVDNLEVMTQSEHARLHFTGKKHSEEHIRKSVEARRHNKGKGGNT